MLRGGPFWCNYFPVIFKDQTIRYGIRGPSALTKMLPLVRKEQVGKTFTKKHPYFGQRPNEKVPKCVQWAGRRGLEVLLDTTHKNECFFGEVIPS